MDTKEVQTWTCSRDKIKINIAFLSKKKKTLLIWRYIIPYYPHNVSHCQYTNEQNAAKYLVELIFKLFFSLSLIFKS